ncbi:MAG TPA: hypothetical protein VMC85_06540 [Desulfomonilaceae bacterium]|nr:hypothetical protein [Desulfomonilaceae bacterium]
MTDPQIHKQVFMKVNVPVDEAIADLIAALSAFPKLQTKSSCQGGPNHPARVFFIYGDYQGKDFWRDLAEFALGFFGPALAREIGDRATVSLQVCESGLIQAELVVWLEALPLVLKALKKIHKRFVTKVDRNSGCFGDTPGTRHVDYSKCQAHIG